MTKPHALDDATPWVLLQVLRMRHFCIYRLKYLISACCCPGRRRLQSVRPFSGYIKHGRYEKALRQNFFSPFRGMVSGRARPAQRVMATWLFYFRRISSIYKVTGSASRATKNPRFVICPISIFRVLGAFLIWARGIIMRVHSPGRRENVLLKRSA